MSTYNINLYEVCYSLSDALDLVGVMNIHHGKRVAYMAAECAKVLGWSDAQLDTLYQAAILHDCGVSKTIVHQRLSQLDWENDQEHCLDGARLLMTCPLLSDLAEIIRFHHSHWQQLKDLDLPWQTKLYANCIFLADRLDILTLTAVTDQSNILLFRDEILKTLVALKDDWFCPELMDALLEVTRSEAFWFRLESGQINGYTHDWLSHNNCKSIEFAELRSLFHLFSVIVDAKSSFTKQHSEGVAKLARFIGELSHLPERSCELLELSGLLHDLGKLRVPDELLDKPGRLTEDEYTLVKRHSFDTFNVLKNIQGLQDVALWAAYHHERIDGSGYPYHLQQTSISAEARIIAVADVFQALAQNRPYRTSLPPEQILHILREQVESGQLDQDIFNLVATHLQACWEIAISPETTPTPN
jgi:HD-GYP domain-containing protein (c-di-GMP phosphodiesterase class II)